MQKSLYRTLSAWNNWAQPSCHFWQVSVMSKRVLRWSKSFFTCCWCDLVGFLPNLNQQGRAVLGDKTTYMCLIMSSTLSSCCHPSYHTYPRLCLGFILCDVFAVLTWEQQKIWFSESSDVSTDWSTHVKPTCTCKTTNNEKL